VRISVSKEMERPDVFKFSNVIKTRAQVFFVVLNNFAKRYI